MGKMSERFNAAQKLASTPLGKTAISLTRMLDKMSRLEDAAVENDDETLWEKADTLDDQIEALLEEQFQSLNGPSFEQLLNVCYTQMEPKPNSTELWDTLNTQLDFMVEHKFTETTYGAMMVLPVRFTSTFYAHNMTLSSEQEDHISDILKKARIVAEHAQLSYVPRLLSSDEGLVLQYYEFYKILNCLHDQKQRDAVSVIVQARLKEGYGFPAMEKLPSPVDTGGYLVAYVSTTTQDHALFPWSEQLNNSRLDSNSFDIEPMDQPTLLSTDLSEMDSELNCDITLALHEASKKLQTVLKVADLDILTPEVDTIENMKLLAQTVRIENAERAFKSLTHDLCIDNLDYDFEPSEDGLLIRIHDLDSTMQATMLWPYLHNELGQDAVEELMNFMDGQYD